MCVDAKTGKEVWRKEVGEGFGSNNRNNLAGPSALTDGKTGLSASAKRWVRIPVG